jgi:hypothetical protein
MFSGLDRYRGRRSLVAVLREVLNVRDVALELRCSETHVYNVINGKVKNVSRLPTITMGRRKLVQRATLEDWKRTNEQGEDDDFIALSRVKAAGHIEEDLCA